MCKMCVSYIIIYSVNFRLNQHQISLGEWIVILMVCVCVSMRAHKRMLQALGGAAHLHIVQYAYCSTFFAK